MPSFIPRAHTVVRLRPGWTFTKVVDRHFPIYASCTHFQTGKNPPPHILPLVSNQLVKFFLKFWTRSGAKCYLDFSATQRATWLESDDSRYRVVSCAAFLGGSVAWHSKNRLWRRLDIESTGITCFFESVFIVFSKLLKLINVTSS